MARICYKKTKLKAAKSAGREAAWIVVIAAWIVAIAAIAEIAGGAGAWIVVIAAIAVIAAWIAVIAEIAGRTEKKKQNDFLEKLIEKEVQKNVNVKRRSNGIRAAADIEHRRLRSSARRHSNLRENCKKC